MLSVFNLMLVTLALAAPSLSWAEGKRVLPRSEQADGGYVSTQLLLKPCLDVLALTGQPDAELQKAATEARQTLPPGACDSPALVEKLFQARFLQYASLTMVRDPWNLDTQITAQNQTISRCPDTHCLERELDAAIAALLPVYQDAQPTWPQGKGLCATDPVASTLKPFSKAMRKTFAAECGAESIAAQTCQGPHGKMVFVGCQMQGNQVNAPEWLFRARRNGLEQILAIDNGPFGVLESTCNGMPDLMTSARISMGEHGYTYYRYDGKQYQSVYAYTEIGVGTDDNGNDLAIAPDAVADTPVVCL